MKRFAPARVPWQAQLLVLAAIWGTSFLLIKIGDRSMSPYQVAAGRIGSGALTLALLLRLQRGHLPRSARTWGHLAVVAILNSVVPWTLFAWGETVSTSVLAGILNATTPLTTAVVAMFMLDDERPTRRRSGGLLLGFAGVILLLGPWRSAGGQALGGNLAFLGAAASYGIGFPYLRRYLTGLPDSVVSLAAAQLICASVEMGLILPFLWTPLHATASSAVAVGLLGAVGTGLAYAINLGIVRSAGATAASTVTYLIPIFATVIGVVALGERLSWNVPLGALVVLLGVAVTQRRAASVPKLGPWTTTASASSSPAPPPSVSRSAPPPS